MKYIEITKYGGPEVLTLVEGPPPEPGADEVLIKVEAAGVNRPDVVQRMGLYPPPPGSSEIPGLEVAGEIVALGKQTKSQSLKLGDKVCALVAGGGYAEYCVAPLAQCLLFPKGMNALEAAAIPENFMTVWTNLFTRGKLKNGESVLIHGGSSGIGTAAIQLAKNFGAKVFITAGNDEKCAFCLELGADGAVNYKLEDFVEGVRRLNDGNGVDVILDMVGGDYFSRNLDLLSPEGRLIQIATQMGKKVELFLPLMMSKRLTIMGSTLRPQSVAQKGVIAQHVFKNVWPLFESRKIRPILDQKFDLARAADAHRRMESSVHIGKIMLTIN